jgi:hypothetical protein
MYEQGGKKMSERFELAICLALARDCGRERGIVIPIVKIDIECIDLIMVIHFTFSVTGKSKFAWSFFLKGFPSNPYNTMASGTP